MKHNFYIPLIFNILIFIIISLSSPSSAQNVTLKQNYSFKQIGKHEGLSNAAVTSSSVDSQGNLWIGTWDCLNKYTNRYNEIFKPNSSASAPTSNVILKVLTPQKDNKVWLLTKREIACYDPSTGLFNKYLNPLPSSAFNEKYIRMLEFNDDVWVYIVGWGIGKYDAVTDDFVKIISPSLLKRHGISSQINFTIYHDIIYVFDEVDNKLSTFRISTGFKKINEVHISGDFKRTWLTPFKNTVILTRTSKDKTLIYDCVKDLKFETESLKGISTVNPAVNGLWLGSNEGKIFKMNIEKDFALQDFTFQLRGANYSFSKIWEINEYSDKILLVSTDGEGVFIFNSEPHKFQSLFLSDAHNERFQYFAKSLHIDPKNNVFMGGKNGELFQMPLKSMHMELLAKLPYNILSINNDQHYNLWIGVDGQGMAYYDFRNERLLKFPDDFLYHDNLVNEINNVYAIHVDMDNNIWLGTSYNGLFKVIIDNSNSKQKPRIVSVDQISEYKGEIIPAIYAIVQEEPNILWFGSRGNGVYRYNLNKQQITHQYIDESGYLDVLSLEYDFSQKHLFIGSSNGLQTISLLGNNIYEIDHYNETNGLASNTIHSIQSDLNKNLWLSTNTGISKINQETRTVDNYNSEMGLANYEYNDGASIKTKSGSIWMAGSKSIDVFFPEDIKPNKNHLDIVFTKLATSDNDYLLFDSQEIELDSEETSFTISFNDKSLGLILSDHDFKYKLHPLDDEFTITDNNEIRYTNVPHGNYTLQLYSRLGKGNWNQNPVLLSIKVAPPWFKTTSFNAFAVLVLFLIGYAILLFYKRRIIVREQEMQKQLQDDEIKNLNDEKFKLYNSIIHEIKTPVSLILPSASLLRKQSFTPDTQRLVDSIYDNTKHLHDLSHQMSSNAILHDQENARYFKVMSFGELLQVIASSFNNSESSKVEFKAQRKIIGWVNPLLFKRTVTMIISLLYDKFHNTIEINLHESSSDEKIIIMISMQATDSNALEWAQNSMRKNALDDMLSKNNGVSTLSCEGNSLCISLVFTPQPPSQSYTGNSSFKTPVLTSQKPNSNAWQGNVNAEAQNILVINASEGMFEIIKNVLTQKYNIILRNNIENACSLVEKKLVQLAIVDTYDDQKLVFKLVNKLKNKIPVIQISDDIDEMTKLKALEQGVSSYIVKPFFPKHLLIRVDQLILPMTSSKSPLNNTNVQKLNIEDYVIDNITNPDLSAEGWADHLNISKSHLYKKVKKETGMSPHNFILDKKLDFSIDLLNNLDLTINEVLFSSGFNNRIQFYRVFKKKYNMSPKEYRLSLSETVNRK
ncbi:helix-turn-helix domain-containing protein [Aureibacter tunicatorum]|uniref:histidine kinase n=1 Tax=Aureibacter tunicatorum TaxID=866807 RepID=A0AAE4BST0_9BACT|nr:helix-turn-helix domain-containing protein [Aureibacter tunicatorum]MDR6241524.1 ligand-binding sensor domain-containing protein/AraC-like DNA-binding protein [Aureibacter tunicatorum]BDD07018.1 hybrid sensor histidine kinase/response regulator [Aureibacter tunicatorum]